MAITNKGDNADEASLFTEAEFRAALEIVTSPQKAREAARELSSPRDPEDDGPSWVLSPEVLDLLSLVSDRCAERVRIVLQLSADEAHERRKSVAKRFSRALP